MGPGQLAEPTIRMMSPDDRARPFDGAGGLAGRLSMPALASLHSPADGKVVLFAEFGGSIVGAIALQVEDTAVHVEFLTRNGLARLPPGLRVGGPLLEAAAAIGRERGALALTLEAMDDADVLAFYRRSGFTASGPPFFEPGWGVLLPMTRPLRPPA